MNLFKIRQKPYTEEAPGWVLSSGEPCRLCPPDAPSVRRPRHVAESTMESRLAEHAAYLYGEIRPLGRHVEMTPAAELVEVAS